MLICGVKLTHDGAVALVDGQKLVFATEVEKIAGNPRYSELRDTAAIAGILATFGYTPRCVDRFVLDGWGALAPNDPEFAFLETRHETHLKVSDGQHDYVLSVARYQERSARADVLERRAFSGLRIGGEAFDYASTLHSAGHILSAYCTSPMARRLEDSYVLVWDGGIYPSLYYVRATDRSVEILPPLFKLFGNAYAMFARNFPPFQGADEHGLSTAGKVMAYIAQGEVRPPLLRTLKAMVPERNTFRYDFPKKLARLIEAKMEGQGYGGADFMMTFHEYLRGLLCATLRDRMAAEPTSRRRNLCLSGGCALNIKWNTAIRELGIFDNIFVPPFPNDAGSAIGAACVELFVQAPRPHLEWDVYSGPRLRSGPAAHGWEARAVSVAEVARLLYETGEPLVFLHGRAELGPRALGGRSILASPGPLMKDLLNSLKGREAYRPVAPVCLEDRAEEVFDPGSPDPFMLFEHRVRPEWRDRIPAVMHLDGTARLQTVNRLQNPVLTELLEAYERLSGLPVLCNTSANASGRGFFPDPAAAMAWGRVNYVYGEGLLYSRPLPAH